MADGDPLAALLSEQEVVILDGGLATALELRGADLNDPLWSAKLLVEDPSMIRDLHADYFRAGADVAISASYQASFEGFRERGIGPGEAAELIVKSVSLASEAREMVRAEADRPLLVAASIGCYGAVLHDGSEYRGDYGLTLQELMDFHGPRLELLASTEADLLACETIPSQLEAEALAKLLKDFPARRAWMSFSCRNGDEVSHGETLRACLELVESSEEIVAVGINCTAPGFVSSLLRSVNRITKKNLLVYPNSGERWDAEGKRWTASPEPSGITRLAQEWHQLGARLIGGCCRTTPRTIGALSQLFRS